MTKALKTALLDWDGKSKHTIQKVFEDYSQETDFINQLLLLINQDSMQNGATWLLKHCIEQGQELSKAESDTLLGKLTALVDWQAKLHVLQILPSLHIDAKYKQTLFRFLHVHISDTNKFVRAWSYNGLYIHALSFPEFQVQAQEMIDLALKDEAPSVKARLRNIPKF